MRIGTTAWALLCVTLAGCGGDSAEDGVPEASAAGEAEVGEPVAAPEGPEEVVEYDPPLPPPGVPVVVEGGQYRDLTVAELQFMLMRKDFPMINVHIPFAGNIPGTDASIAYNQIASNLDQLPADKNARIVLYCRNGPMSVTAARTLVGLGYTNVHNLVGGFAAWSSAGLPLQGL
jgi:rhodanese-related sulfurtransferase